MSDIFISYKHGEGSDFVKKLASALKSEGNVVWYDTDIPEGLPWKRTILNAIFRCGVFIVVLTEDALNSSWVTIECNIAFSLEKKILPVISGVSVENVPEYLRLREAVLGNLDDDKTIENVVNAIKEIYPYSKQNSFWYELFKKGIDIYIPCEEFRKKSDQVKTDDQREKASENHTTKNDDEEFQGVNISSLNAALKLQEGLLQEYFPHLQNRDAIKIDYNDTEIDESSDRNLIILGGPGGMPSVHEILKRWSRFDLSEDANFSGYRYIVRQSLVNSGPFLRESKNESLGIEDVRIGEEPIRYNINNNQIGIADSKEKLNYGVIYTKGFDLADKVEKKIIILSPYSRSVFPGMIEFLMNSKKRSEWIKEVTTCGEYSETLLSFRLSSSKVNLLKKYPTRALKIAKS